MNVFLKPTAVLFFYLCFSLLANAQINVDNTITPEQALAILLGGGVEVSNVQFSGDANQIGSFLGENSNLGMNGGIILGSGDVAFAEFGTNGISGGNDGGGGTLGGGNFGVGDPDLTQISGVQMHDAAILEFDFIALGEEVRFDYIFASEEYNNFVCANVNDAFGFFLSGPGLDGPFTNNAINLALVPGTDVPVTINSVNNGTVGASGTEANCAQYGPDWADNSIYFFDNTLINGPEVISYDGFTVMLEAFAAVQCGGSYHIKIAIADGGDTAYDSAVFLRQGSFDSPGIVISANLTNTIDENTIYESCGGAEITFERVGNVEQEYVLEIAYSGTVEVGSHVEPLPETVVFAPGESAVSIEVVPIPNDIVEGTLELIIEVTTSGCDGETTTFSLFINDDPVELELDANVPECPGDEVTVQSTVTGGVAPYTYLWSTGDVDDAITASYDLTETVHVTVTDACDSEVTTYYTIEVPQPEPIMVMIDGVFSLDCPDIKSLEPLVGGGSQPYSFEWFSDGDLIGEEQNIDVQVDDDRDVSFVVTDGCSWTHEITVELLLVDHPPIEVEFENPEICYGTSISLPISVDGGFEPLSIYWEHDASEQWSTNVSPTRDTTYPFRITDGCGDLYEYEVNVFVFQAYADFTFDYWSDTEISFTNNSQNNFINEWTFGDGGTSDEENPVHDYNELSVYTPVTLWVETEQGCRDVAHAVIPPYMTAFVPNAFTPDNDGLNELFEFVLVGVKSFEFRVFNRWGEEVFYTNQGGKFWNGSVNNGAHYSPDGVYVWVLEMQGFESNTERLTGTVMVIR